MNRGNIALIANTSIGLIAALIVGIVIWFRLDIPTWAKILLTLVDLYIFAATAQYVAPFITIKLVNKFCDYFNIQYANDGREWLQKQREREERQRGE
ncbi:MAG: hypothetical protein GY943_04325 [Chloroflexi bacterium]|nr:hypothetical protein [Chloroflexota bacterium]